MTKTAFVLNVALILASGCKTRSSNAEEARFAQHNSFAKLAPLAVDLESDNKVFSEISKSAKEIWNSAVLLPKELALPLEFTTSDVLVSLPVQMRSPNYFANWRSKPSIFPASFTRVRIVNRKELTDKTAFVFWFSSLFVPAPKNPKTPPVVQLEISDDQNSFVPQVLPLVFNSEKNGWQVIALPGYFAKHVASKMVDNGSAVFLQDAIEKHFSAESFALPNATTKLRVLIDGKAMSGFFPLQLNFPSQTLTDSYFQLSAGHQDLLDGSRIVEANEGTFARLWKDPSLSESSTELPETPNLPSTPQAAGFTEVSSLTQAPNSNELEKKLSSVKRTHVTLVCAEDTVQGSESNGKGTGKKGSLDDSSSKRIATLKNLQISSEDSKKSLTLVNNTQDFPLFVALGSLLPIGGAKTAPFSATDTLNFTVLAPQRTVTLVPTQSLWYGLQKSTKQCATIIAHGCEIASQTNLSCKENGGEVLDETQEGLQEGTQDETQERVQQ